MTPIKHFNELPLDIVLLVFRRFALQELFIARAVCRDWRSVIENEIFATRRSLKLFPSFDDVIDHVYMLQGMGLDAEPLLRLRNDGLEDDLIIKLSQIEPSFVSQFAKLFPRIESLVLHIKFHSPFVELGNLIKMWSGTLRHISIFGHPLGRCDSGPLYEALPSVVHLTRLDISSIHFEDDPVDLRLVPIIPQLQALTLNGFNNFEPIFVALRDCTELWLNWLVISYEDFQQTFDKNRAITHKITKFWLDHDDPIVINVICDNLKNLRHLDLQMRIDLDASILREFAKLSHLDSLHLSAVRIDLDNLTAAYVARSLPVLGSVKTVLLFPAPFQKSGDDTSGKDDRFCRLIRFIFPAIVQLQLLTKKQKNVKTIKRWRLPDCALTIRRANSTENAARQLGRHRARYLRK